MLRSTLLRRVIPVVAALSFAACSDDITGPNPPPSLAKGAPGAPVTEGAGNNLSFPVVWAEGVTKVLRGTAGDVTTDGAWWHWWGQLDEQTPLSCAPDPQDLNRCDDGNPATATGTDVVQTYGSSARRAYLQKDADNEWQAGSLDHASLGTVVVDSIDWGDDLESKDWTLKSQVRIEHVLLDVLSAPLTQYVMRHTSGWGADEVHGLSVVPGSGQQLPTVETVDSYVATVFSPCGRLTIQRLNVTRDSLLLDPTLITWNPTTKQWTGTAVKAPIFNKAVWEAADGPGYFNAEINVKGKIIFGYTWNVRKLNDGAGDYRITFSLDAACGGTVVRNTDFVLGTTTIIVAEEEEEVTVAAEPGDVGGVGQLNFTDKLTYMDIRIVSGTGGGKGGGGGGGSPGGHTIDDGTGGGSGGGTGGNGPGGPGGRN